MNNTDTYSQVYITPYTGFTIFCLFWICGSALQAISQPVKVIYAIIATIIGGLAKVVRYAGKKRRGE